MSKRAKAINTCIDVLMNRPDVAEAIRKFYNEHNISALKDAVYKAAYKQWKFLNSTRTSARTFVFYESVIHECIRIITYRSFLSHKNLNN